MLRPLIALLGVLACGIAVAADEDAVAKKLQAAKDEYDAKIEKVEAAIAKWFDKREAAAQSAGNKKVAEQVKADRAAFSEFGTLPQTAPVELRKPLAGARTAYEAAMLAAIKDFTRLKRDDDAAAIEKALRDFRMRDWKLVDTSKATFKDEYFQIPPNTDVPTRQKFPGGFEVVIVARTEAENIRLRAQRGSVVIFNWEVNPRELRVHRPDGNDRPESGSIATAKVTPLKPNTWYTIKWRLTEDGTQVSVDGKVVFEELRAYDLNAPAPVVVRSMNSVIDLKEFHITPLVKGR
jgi:hypothetical protein